MAVASKTICVLADCPTPELCKLTRLQHFALPSSCSKGCCISLKLVCCLPCQLFLKELVGAVRRYCEGVASLRAKATTYRMANACSSKHAPSKMQFCSAWQVASLVLEL